MTEPIDVFISHHGKQGRRFYETFRDRFAEDNLTTKSHYDFGDAEDAEDERKECMREIIGSAKWFFFIATNKSCESEEALEEIRAAQAEGIPIITLRANEVMPDKLPEELKGHDSVHVKDAPETIREVIEDVARKKPQPEEKKQPESRHQNRENRGGQSRDGAHAEQNDTVAQVLVAGLILGALIWLSRK